MSSWKKILNKILRLFRYRSSESRGSEVVSEDTETHTTTNQTIGTVGITSEDTQDETATLTKKTQNQIQKLISDVQEANKGAKQAIGTARRSEMLVYVGFLVLCFMGIALIIDRLTFVFDNNQYLSDKITTQEIKSALIEHEFKAFKKCIKAKGWNSCLTE